MHYDNISRGTFLSRPNRFIAHVKLNGETVTCHVKNTGRCRELLVPGATVYLQACDNPSRKTKFDLIGVEKKTLCSAQDDRAGFAQDDRVSDAQEEVRLINMDAQAPNKAFGEWAAAGQFVPGLTLLRPETTFGKSRFDFYWEAGLRRGFVEVKGVTLERAGAAYFPDAPTQRGVKHVEELMAAKTAGYEACLFLVVQMAGVDFWSPNDATHPEFGAAVRRAAASGVEIRAYDCKVTAEGMDLRQPVEVRL